MRSSLYQPIRDMISGHARGAKPQARTVRTRHTQAGSRSDGYPHSQIRRTNWRGCCRLWTLEPLREALNELLTSATAAYPGQHLNQTCGVRYRNHGRHLRHTRRSTLARVRLLARPLMTPPSAFRHHSTAVALPLIRALEILLAFTDTYRFADDLGSVDNPFRPHLLPQQQRFLGVLSGIQYTPPT